MRSRHLVAAALLVFVSSPARAQLTAGRIQWLAADALPIEGGVPIIVSGQVIGAVGVSGATSAQDAQVASAGIAALKQTIVRDR